VFPHNKVDYQDIRSDQQYSTLVVMIPQGQYYARVDDQFVEVEVVIDQTLVDVEVLLMSNESFNSLDWGAFITGYADSGRRYIDNQLDYQYPDRVRLRARYDIGYDIEQNFVSRGSLPSWYDWISPNGNRFLLLTVRGVRSNAHGDNANFATRGQYVPQPPSQPFYSSMPQPQPQQPFQSQNNFAGGATPQHSNGGGFAFPPTQQYQSPPGQQPFQSPPRAQQPFQSTPPGQQYQSPPAQQPYQSPPAQQPYQSPPAQQQQQYNPAPATQQYYQQQQQHFKALPTKQPAQQQPAQGAFRPNHVGFTPTQPAPRPPPVNVYTARTHIDPNQPTPGVATAASMPQTTQNMSMSSEWTEQTVEEQPQKVPAKKSFFKTVGDIMTGSHSDESDLIEHMKQPPKKYYGQNKTKGTGPNTVTTVDSSASSSDPSL